MWSGFCVARSGRFLLFSFTVITLLAFTIWTSRIEPEHVTFKPPTWEIWEPLRHLVSPPRGVCLNAGNTHTTSYIPCSQAISHGNMAQNISKPYMFKQTIDYSSMHLPLAIVNLDKNLDKNLDILWSSAVFSALGRSLGAWHIWHQATSQKAAEGPLRRCPWPRGVEEVMLRKQSQMIHV